jgi:hypothetical protein
MPQISIPHQRLYNQCLTTAPFEQAADVVHWLVAVQSQEYADAKWSLGLRMRAATDAVIEQAFNAGAILRTHLMRPTWHFVTPGDIRWLLALTAPRVHALNASYYRNLGLDQGTLQRSHHAIEKALRDGNHLTRKELRTVLDAAGISTDADYRMNYIMMHAELQGIICSGPRRGKQFTYALLEERAPHARTLENDAALAELAQRYFVSRGPATIQDFSKWSGLTIADARLGLEAVQSELETEEIHGKTYWFSPLKAATQERSAYLLSIYDEYISSYKGWETIVGEQQGAHMIAMGNNLSAIIVLNGHIRGTWKRKITKKKVEINLNPFTPFAEDERELFLTAAQRYGQYLGLPVSVVEMA